MRWTLAFGLAVVVLAVGCTGTEEPPFKPMATVKDLMQSVVDPAADIVWDAVGTVVSEKGIEEWAPETDEEWARVRGASMILMESGNLLMMGDRARDNAAWMRMAQGLVDAGARALEATEARDPEAVFDIGEEVYNSCNSCHNLYWVGDEDRGRVRDDTLRGG